MLVYKNFRRAAKCQSFCSALIAVRVTNIFLLQMYRWF